MDAHPPSRRGASPSRRESQSNGNPAPRHHASSGGPKPVSGVSGEPSRRIVDASSPASRAADRGGLAGDVNPGAGGVSSGSGAPARAPLICACRYRTALLAMVPALRRLGTQPAQIGVTIARCAISDPSCVPREPNVPCGVCLCGIPALRTMRGETSFGPWYACRQPMSSEPGMARGICHSQRQDATQMRARHSNGPQAPPLAWHLPFVVMANLRCSSRSPGPGAPARLMTARHLPAASFLLKQTSRSPNPSPPSVRGQHPSASGPSRQCADTTYKGTSKEMRSHAAHSLSRVNKSTIEVSPSSS